MTTINLKNGTQIQKNNYRSASKHRDQVLNVCRELGISFEFDNSTKTGSYYINLWSKSFEIYCRFSNHTKPSFGKNQHEVVKLSNDSDGYKRCEISVMSSDDFKVAMSLINQIVNAKA